uniref:MARVEL domain-containing protein n=1 Tax=Cyprinus carpio TaxID=7962 RepID=A0A8C1V3I0_CYPCA
MPESSRHHHTRDKDYSSRDRRDEGGHEDRIYRDDSSRSHREKHRYTDTQRDTRYHRQGVYKICMFLAEVCMHAVTFCPGCCNVFNRPSYTETSSSYYDDSQPYHHKGALYNLRYITTSRGICQAMGFFLILLIVICAGVNHSNSGRYQDIASLGGLYHYYYGGANAFTGAEAQKVHMVCGGALMLYACATLVFRMPYRFPPLLLAEALLDLQEIYNNPICKEREAMYSSKGHRGFECNLNGADIAGGLFGVLGIIIFPISAVLAIRALIRVRKMKQRPTEDNNL